MHASYDMAVLVALFTALAAAIDFRSQKIPNWLTVSSAALGLAYHSLSPDGIGPLWALAGFAVGFSLLFVPWLLGGGGMGDVKMLAALGVWLGPLWILAAFGCGAILAAMGAMLVLTSNTVHEGVSSTKNRYLSTGNLNFGSAVTAASRQRKTRRVLPFAVPMALATWLVVAWLMVRQ
jgi:prepilin peptidase CpaA